MTRRVAKERILEAYDLLSSIGDGLCKWCLRMHQNETQCPIANALYELEKIVPARIGRKPWLDLEGDK